MRQKNQVLIRGTIVHFDERRTHTFVRIVTDKAIQKFFLNVLFRNEDLKGFHIGDYVTIEAYISDSVERRRTSQYYIGNIYGIRIERTPRVLKNYLPKDIQLDPDGPPLDDENLALIIGKCYNVIKAHPNHIILCLSVKDRQRTCRCDIICKNNHAAVAADIANGDYVAVVGYVKLKKDEETKKLTQQVMCTDVARIAPEFITD